MQLVEDTSEHWRLSLSTGETINITLYDNFEDLQKTFTSLKNTSWSALEHFTHREYEAALKKIMGFRPSECITINHKIVRTSAIMTAERIS